MLLVSNVITSPLHPLWPAKAVLSLSTDALTEAWELLQPGWASL